MLLSRCKNKYSIGGRLFQRFQEGIERGSTQHVNLIDDIHLVFAKLRRITHLLYQSPDVIHRIVGSCIKLVYIQRIAGIERNTGSTNITSLYIRRNVLAIYCLRKNSRGGGFSNSS